MTQGYGTQTDVMVTVANRLEAVNAELQSELRGLQGRLSGLPAVWQGLGANAFAGTMERWNTDAARMNTALLGISERVKQGAGRYDVSDQDAQSMLNALGGDAGGGGGAGGGQPGGGAISNALG